MKESIHIQNFGPLRDVRIDDIKPLTVLIGDSASGKSTIMKVVALMRYMCMGHLIERYFGGAQITKSSYSMRFESLLHDGLEQMFNSGTTIKYTVHLPGGLEHVVDYPNGSSDDFGVLLKFKLGAKDDFFFKESYVAETRSLIPAWSLSGATARRDSMGGVFDVMVDDFLEATDHIRELPLDYLGMKMKVEKKPTRKHFLISPNDESSEAFELEYASSGIQASVPLMTIVRYFSHQFSLTNAFRHFVLGDPKTPLKPWDQDLKKYIHLYIEEPELSLDPKTQCLFINDLIREAFYRGDNKRPDDGRQLGLMFATHSPYILNHLNVLLKASYYEKARERYPYINPDEIAVYRLHDGEVHSLVEDDEETGERIIDTYKFSETMEWILDKYESVD